MGDQWILTEEQNGTRIGTCPTSNSVGIVPRTQEQENSDTQEYSGTSVRAVCTQNHTGNGVNTGKDGTSVGAVCTQDNTGRGVNTLIPYNSEQTGMNSGAVLRTQGNTGDEMNTGKDGTGVGVARTQGNTGRRVTTDHTYPSSQRSECHECWHCSM